MVFFCMTPSPVKALQQQLQKISDVDRKSVAISYFKALR